MLKFYARIGDIIEELRNLGDAEKVEIDKKCDDAIQPQIESMIPWIGAEMGEAAAHKFVEKDHEQHVTLGGFPRTTIL